MSGISPDLLKHALGAARRLGMDQVELSENGECFSARLTPLDDWSEESADEAIEAAGPVLKPLTATVVGYLNPLVDWTEGSQVEGGKPVAEIQALGLGNDILAPASGRLVQIQVEGGQAVEFGQILAQVECEP